MDGNGDGDGRRCRLFARRMKASVDVQNQAAEIRLRASDGVARFWRKREEQGVEGQHRHW